jgi:hypothetical protein
MHELVPFRISLRSVFTLAGEPATACIARRRRFNRGCVIVIGAVVRSAVLVSVLPGRQERHFVVTTVSG